MFLDDTGFRKARELRCNARPAHRSFWKHTGLCELEVRVRVRA